MPEVFANVESLSDLLPVLGRLHPAILHMPIGLLIGLFLFEMLQGLRGKPMASRFLVLLATVTAVLAATSGLLLHEEPSYVENETMEWHERLGIATAAGSLAVLVLRLAGRTALYRLALLVTVGVLVPTGHFGAEMVHGKNFILEPLEKREIEPEPEVETTPTLATFDAQIMPIFEKKCIECHGDSKVKGGLRMDSHEALLTGGDGGPAIEAGVEPEDQELLYRILLPLDDDDHMPPDHKVQLGAGEVAMIRAWLAAGAPASEPFATGDIPDEWIEGPAEEETVSEPSEQEEPIGLAPAPEAVLQGLREQLIHVQPVEMDSVHLWVDFAAPATQVDDELVRASLTPLVEHVADLSLARTQVTDTSLDLIAAMPSLARLDLRETAVTARGLQALQQHPTLQELVLTRTQLDDSAVETLLSLPKLAAVWLWDAGISEDALASLQEARPALRIDVGDLSGSVALETEEKPEFTSDAPPLDAAPAAEEELASLAPINTTCPVSGSPVNPKYRVVYDGKVIGFCCPNCPKSFWDDPAGFLAKLEQETAD